MFAIECESLDRGLHGMTNSLPCLADFDLEGKGKSLALIDTPFVAGILPTNAQIQKEQYLIIPTIPPRFNRFHRPPTDSRAMKRNQT